MKWGKSALNLTSISYLISCQSMKVENHLIKKLSEIEVCFGFTKLLLFGICVFPLSVVGCFIFVLAFLSFLYSPFFFPIHPHVTPLPNSSMQNWACRSSPADLNTLSQSSHLSPGVNVRRHHFGPRALERPEHNTVLPSRAVWRVSCVVKDTGL